MIPTDIFIQSIIAACSALLRKMPFSLVSGEKSASVAFIASVTPSSFNISIMSDFSGIKGQMTYIYMHIALQLAKVRRA